MAQRSARPALVASWGAWAGTAGGNIPVPFPARSRYPVFMPKLFDPLAWLRSKSVTVNLKPDGEIELLFDEYTRRETRERIKRIIFRYYRPVLRLQLDVPPGTMPRTVRQLIAAGRLRVAVYPEENRQKRQKFSNSLCAWRAPKSPSQAPSRASTSPAPFSFFPEKTSG